MSSLVGLGLGGSGLLLGGLFVKHLAQFLAGGDEIFNGFPYRIGVFAFYSLLEVVDCIFDIAADVGGDLLAVLFERFFR